MTNRREEERVMENQSHYRTHHHRCGNLSDPINQTTTPPRFQEAPLFLINFSQYSEIYVLFGQPPIGMASLPSTAVGGTGICQYCRWVSDRQ